MNLINFGKAVEKWQIKLGLEVMSLVDKKMLINQQKNLLQQGIRIRDLFTDTFCLQEWNDRKNDKSVVEALKLLHKVGSFDSFIQDALLSIRSR